MKASLEIISVATKVLTAVTGNQLPDPADLQILRNYLKTANGRDLDELACDAIQKALQHRALLRRPSI